MANEEWDASEPHGDTPPLGQVDFGRRTLAAAIARVPSKHDPRTALSFDTVFPAPIDVSDIRYTPLPHIESLLVGLGTEAGFYLLSGFADRHGFWEMRLADRQTSSTGLISFACDDSTDTDLLRCELSAGYFDEVSSHRSVVGQFNLIRSEVLITSEQTNLIKRSFDDAVRRTRPPALAL